MIRQMVAGHCLFDFVLFGIGRILDPVPSTVLRQDDWSTRENVLWAIKHLAEEGRCTRPRGSDLFRCVSVTSILRRHAGLNVSQDCRLMIPETLLESPNRRLAEQSVL